MKKTKININLTILLLFAVAFLNAQEDEGLHKVIEEITFEGFYKHLEYLSVDEMRGRGTGTEEYKIAANYVAEEFRKNGLQPFPEINSFLQEVPLMQGTFKEPSVQFKVKGSNGEVSGIFGKDISLFLDAAKKRVDKEQELAFVGYGNIIPGKNINDFKGVEVKGKTVVIALGNPKGITDEKYNNPFEKIQNAIKMGAEGVVFFSPKSRFQNLIFKQMHKYVGSSRMVLSDSLVAEPVVDMEVVAFTKKSFIADVFKINGLSLKKELKEIANGENRSKELDAQLRCSYDVEQENKNCFNVVALLPGTDPVLKNEYIVIGSHLDHLGVGEPVKGDSIYNGMWDNASGVSALICISEAFKKMEERPQRSIVFVAYTAEEKGLLGSTYYAAYNHVGDGKIVANLNIDMLGSLYETQDIVPLGYSHSNLSEAVDFSAKTMGLTVTKSKHLEDLYLERSDQMSFIKKGIPALYSISGLKAVDSNVDVTKNLQKWMKKTYHSPSDDLNQKYSPKAFENAMKVNFLTSYYISTKMKSVEWNKDSKLYKKYVLLDGAPD